jgi:hypothetical protein
MCSCTKLIWFQLEIGAIVRHSKANRKAILADVPGGGRALGEITTLYPSEYDNYISLNARGHMSGNSREGLPIQLSIYTWM